MTTNLDERKLRLIQEIMNLEREEDVSKIEAELKTLLEPVPGFMRAIKPLRATVSLDDLIKEQNYQPIQREAFFAKTKELGLEEPLEELLAMLDE